MFAFVNLAVLIIVLIFADFSAYYRNVVLFNGIQLFGLRSLLKAKDFDIIYLEQDRIGINWIFTSMFLFTSVLGESLICLLTPKF